MDEYLFTLQKMGDDLNIKEKVEQEKLKEESEIRGEKYDLQVMHYIILVNYSQMLHLVKH